MRPNDVPPMRSVRSSFDTWSRDGTFVNINDTLRKLARHALNRDLERDQKLTSRIEPIQEHCNRTEIKKGFA
jgi:transposase